MCRVQRPQAVCRNKEKCYNAIMMSTAPYDVCYMSDHLLVINMPHRSSGGGGGGSSDGGGDGSDGEEREYEEQ